MKQKKTKYKVTAAVKSNVAATVTGSINTRLALLIRSAGLFKFRHC